MSNYSKLYWLTRLDSIQALFVTLAVLAGMVCIAIIIWHFTGNDFDEFYSGETLEKRKARRMKFTNSLKWVAPLGFIFLTMSILIPTKNEMIFIVAGGKTIDWVQSDTSINKIPSQTTAIISEFLDKQIKKIGENPIDSIK